MYDIKFFKKSFDFKHKIIDKQFSLKDENQIFNKLENIRDQDNIHIFNLETTNNCNMRCIMCPRTTDMTRKIEFITNEEFEQTVIQTSIHADNDFQDFINFISKEYNINESTRSENAFYFHVSSKCVTLHGYGEPLIDPLIEDRIKICTKHNIPTYFSCVPANINVSKIIELMKQGLSVIKFSIDSLDDLESKEIRGRKNNFTDAYNKILELLEYKKKLNLKTQIVCTMLDLSTSDEGINKQKRFIELWSDKDVFAYVKSLDNRWYNDLDESLKNKSHYNYQYCEFPWTSMTIMSNGNVVPCTQDYDAEMTFGNIKKNSLKEIWNSEKYKEFRKWHINGNFPKGNKCNERCDLKKIYHYLEDKK